MTISTKTHIANVISIKIMATRWFFLALTFSTFSDLELQTLICWFFQLLWPFSWWDLLNIEAHWFNACEGKNALLTCYNSSGAVLLGVAVLHADGAGVGFCLIGTQRLPLLLQAVLVLQVILHVRLKERREKRRWENRAGATTKGYSSFITNIYWCVSVFRTVNRWRRPSSSSWWTKPVILTLKQQALLKWQAGGCLRLRGAPDGGAGNTYFVNHRKSQPKISRRSFLWLPLALVVLLGESAHLALRGREKWNNGRAVLTCWKFESLISFLNFITLIR